MKRKYFTVIGIVFLLLYHEVVLGSAKVISWNKIKNNIDWGYPIAVVASINSSYYYWSQSLTHFK